MKILAIDSSGLVASVAVVEDGVLIAEYTMNYKKTHSQTLLPMLEEVKKAISLDLSSIDAIAVANRFGIDADRAVDYHSDSVGTQLNYEVLSEAITQVRTCAAPLNASWKSRIEKDFRSRNADR